MRPSPRDGGLPLRGGALALAIVGLGAAFILCSFAALTSLLLLDRGGSGVTFVRGGPTPVPTRIITVPTVGPVVTATARPGPTAPAKPTLTATQPATPPPKATPDRRLTPLAGGLGPTAPSPPHRPVNLDLVWTATSAGVTVTTLPGGVRAEASTVGNAYIVTASPRQFTDVTVEAVLRQDRGGPGSDYGLALQRVDGNNLVVFVVTADGNSYAVWQKRTDWIRLSTGTTVPAGIIRPMPELNRLRAVIVGTTISVFANEQFLETVRLQEAKAGQVGLQLESKDANSTVTVTEFRVWAP